MLQGFVVIYGGERTADKAVPLAICYFHCMLRIRCEQIALAHLAVLRRAEKRVFISDA